jgi:phosphoglucomutase
MIHFGTSGWRAVMGEEFTFDNVRIVVQAIANFLGKKFPGRDVAVIVNYDTRFLSERYATEAAKILSHNRIRVLLAERDSPSQAQAFQIIKSGVQGGINFTASKPTSSKPRSGGFKRPTNSSPGTPGPRGSSGSTCARIISTSSRRKPISASSGPRASASASTFSTGRAANTWTRSSRRTASRSRRSTATSIRISAGSRPPAPRRTWPS